MSEITPTHRFVIPPGTVTMSIAGSEPRICRCSRGHEWTEEPWHHGEGSLNLFGRTYCLRCVAALLDLEAGQVKVIEP